MRKIYLRGILILNVMFSLFLCKYVFANEKLGQKEYIFNANLNDDEIRERIYADMKNKHEITSIEIEYLKGDSKEFEKIEEKVIESQDNVLSNFEKKIEFSQNGYKGELLRIDKSLIVTPDKTGKEDFDIIKTYNKTYTALPDNDVANISKNIKEDNISMHLTGLKFVITGYETIGKYNIPNLYDAIATYSYTVKNQRDITKTYKVSVLYKNTLQYHVENKAIVKFKELPEIKEIELKTDEENITEEVENNNSKEPFQFIKIILAIFSFLKIIIFIISIITLGIFIFSLIIYLIYLVFYKIKIYNITNDNTIFLNRTRILINKNNDIVKINLSPFQKNIKSLVFKINIPKNIVKKYTEQSIQIMIKRDNKIFIKNLMIKADDFYAIIYITTEIPEEDLILYSEDLLDIYLDVLEEILKEYVHISIKIYGNICFYYNRLNIPDFDNYFIENISLP